MPSALTTTLVMLMAAWAGAAKAQKPAKASSVLPSAPSAGAPSLVGLWTGCACAPGHNRLMQFFIITTPSIENINISEF
ncbi:MAG: hypothetical protein LBE58_01350 [Comamonas sp.]|nr:hypothetical protein [Comamonas sp.]